MDLIYTHPNSEGRIYQCGAREIPGTVKETFNVNWFDNEALTDALDEAGISILALTARGFQPQLDSPYLDVIHIPFDDRTLLEDWKIAQIEKMVKRAARKMARAVEAGEYVLSTCHGGINRSSLLTAYIIKELNKSLEPEQQLAPQQIIDLIRDKRDEHCLDNLLFEIMVIHGFNYPIS